MGAYLERVFVHVRVSGGIFGTCVVHVRVSGGIFGTCVCAC